MDLIHKIESLRYDIENGVVTDVISISARLIQIKDQALQLQQTGVMARCFEDYIGKKFIYKSKITRHNTIFKVIAQFERCGKTVLVSENNNKYYLHEVAPYNEP